MAITFDAVGAGAAGVFDSGDSASFSFSHTATAGADVFLAINVDRVATVSAVEYGGTAMTLLATLTLTGGGAGDGFLSWYHLADAPSGAQSVTGTFSTALFANVNTVSYLGIGSIGTPVTTTGTGASASQSVTCTTGQMIVSAIAGNTGTNSDSSLWSISGGTNRSNSHAITAGNGFTDLAISDATTTTTFAAADAAGRIGFWGASAIILSATSGTSVSPAAATVAVTGGTPTVLTPTAVTPGSATVTVTGDTPVVELSGNVNPATATVTITGGTPSVIIPTTDTPVNPAGADVAVTAGTPQVAQASGPLARVLNNLSLGESAIVQTIGDSTCYGSFDTGFSSVNGQQGFTPNADGVFCGWAGRLCVALGEFFNANVEIRLLGVTAGATIGTMFSYPTGQVYDNPVTLFTATGENRPTLTLYHGGWPGAVMANYLSEISTILGAPNADLVILNDGFNEVSLGTFVTEMGTFASDVHTRYPGALILVNTQNATTITGEGDGVTFANIAQTIVNTFITTEPALPLSPPLQASNNTTGLWVLDTRQAGQIAATLNTDGLHPIAPGYAEQAQFMLNNLTTGLPGLIQDSGLMIPTTAEAVITGGTPGVSIVALGTVTPGSATVTVTGDTPTVVESDNIAAAPTGATVHVSGGTPTVLNQGAPTNITVLPQNTVVIGAELRSVDIRRHHVFSQNIEE